MDISTFINKDLTSQVGNISPFLKQCIKDGAKGKGIPAGSILQVQEISNLSYPKLMSDDQANYDSTWDVLKVTVTDGHSEGYAMVADNCPPGISLETSPGTKIKVILPIPVQGSLFLLTQVNCEVLGGRVAKLVGKWDAQRNHAIKHEWGHTAGTSANGIDSPPPWIHFGQKLSFDIASMRKMKTTDVINTKKDDQLESDKSTFDAQREETISGLKQIECSKFKRPDKHLLAKEVKDIMDKGFSKNEAENAMNTFKDVQKALTFLKNAKMIQDNVPKTSSKIKQNRKDRRVRKGGKDNEKDEEDEQAIPLEYQRPTESISLFGFVEGKIKSLGETTPKTSDDALVKQVDKECEDENKSFDELVRGIMEKLNIMDLDASLCLNSSSPDKDQSESIELNGRNHCDDERSQLCCNDRDTNDERKMRSEVPDCATLRPLYLQSKTDKSETGQESYSQKIDKNCYQTMYKPVHRRRRRRRVEYYNRGNGRYLGRRMSPVDNQRGYQQRSISGSSSRLASSNRGDNEHFRQPQHLSWHGECINLQRTHICCHHHYLNGAPSAINHQYYRQQSMYSDQVFRQNYSTLKSIHDFCQQRPPNNNLRISHHKQHLQSEYYQQRPLSRDVPIIPEPLIEFTQSGFQQRPSSENFQAKYCNHRSLNVSAQASYQQRLLKQDAQGGYQQGPLYGDCQVSHHQRHLKRHVQASCQQRSSKDCAQTGYQQRPFTTGSIQFSDQQRALIREAQVSFIRPSSSGKAKVSCQQFTSNENTHVNYQQQRPSEDFHDSYQLPPSSGNDQTLYQQQYSSGADQLHYQERPADKHNQFHLSVEGNDQLGRYQQPLSSVHTIKESYCKWRLTPETEKMRCQLRALNENNPSYYQERHPGSIESVQLYHARKYNNWQEQKQGEFNESSGYPKVEPSPKIQLEFTNQLFNLERSSFGTGDCASDGNKPVVSKEPAMTVGYWGDSESEQEFLLNTNTTASSLASKMSEKSGWSSFKSGSAGSDFYRRPSNH